MSITWTAFVEGWKTGALTSDPSLLDGMLSDDFTWPTSDMSREQTMAWVRATDFRVTDYCVTLYENDDVIVGMHGVTGDGHDNVVMGIAYLRDGKIHEYHHQRKPV